MSPVDTEPEQVILCTGANRSLGFAILQAAALSLPSAIYILGCRSITDGNEAVSELRKLGVKSDIEVLNLDVTEDPSIFAGVKFVQEKFGKLDVLINNAGIARIPKSPSEIRETYNSTFDTNITSIAVLTSAFLPLLHQAAMPRVINVSSTRGSLTHSTTGKLPLTHVVAYSVSKTALNALTIELQKAEDASKAEENGGKVKFFAASPGHLRTAFNGFRGTREPIDGAEVIVRLTMDEGKYKGGSFWEFEEGQMREVPW